MRAHVIGITFSVIASSFACDEAMASKRSSDAGFKTSSSIRYEVVRTLEHARDDFTEGLEICDGAMLESVGLYGSSALIRKQIDDGVVLRRRPLPAIAFGEGATCMGDRIYQLTWREQAALVYDLDFTLLEVLRYEGEGWGLTHDAQYLIMSNGSATVTFRKPEDFSVVRSIEVHDGKTPVEKINELEYAHGLLFANIWQSDRVAVVSPADGRVLAWLDLAALSTRFDKPAHWNAVDDVLNGIAYDPRRDLFYFTGKRWPVLFELRLSNLPDAPPAAAK
ncbi:MAG: glutaminyl-peptide cyclotransferase [Solimonas sp.]